ncbi:MAG: hypothetical protein ACRDMV_13680 [Streptosporangiales bacterium]
MARRVSLPGASEFFRRTAAADTDAVAADGTPPVRLVPGADEVGEGAQEPLARRSSGRERHDEKITVYVSADELFDLEQARLVLRRQHRLSLDRGRLVREAIACLLEDFEQHGADGVLVQRLRDQ